LAALLLAAVIAAAWLPSTAMAEGPDDAAEEADTANAAADEQSQDVAADEESQDADQKKFREEIVVTAQRREEKLVEVPLAISVFDSASIQDLTATDLVSLGPKMPNVLAGGRFAGNFTIRGISSMAGGPGFPPGVGVELDGVFMGRDRAFNFLLNDIERVEVLRGPQGTLYGKNTIAGTINIVTRRPTNTFEAEGDVNYGNLNFIQARASVGGALVKDKVLGKLSAVYRKRDGYLYNRELDMDENDINEGGARGMLQFNPSDDLRIEFFGDFYSQDDNSGATETAHTFDGSILPFPPWSNVPPQYATDRIVDYIIPHYRKRDIWGGSGHVVYDMNGYELTSITAYREYTSNFRDSYGATIDLFDVGREENLERFSQELRLASPGDNAFSWIIGAYYDNEKLESFRGIRVADAFPSPILGLPPLPPGFQEQAETNVNLDSESFALFVHGRYEFTQNLAITAGLRYTNEMKDLIYSQLPTEISIGLIGLFALPIPLLEDSYEETAPSGDVSLSYSFTPTQTGYLRYAHGFKAGGFQADVISPPPFTPPESLSFKPETVDSYEIGYKGDLANHRLGLNISTFYWDFKDKQEMVNTGISFIVSNAATASSYGAEIELYARPPVDGLDINLSVGWLNAEYDEFPNGGGLGVDFNGNKLAGAPDVTGSFGIQYFAPLGGTNGRNRLFLRGDVDHTGEYYGNPANDPLLKVEAYTTLNARIGLERRDGSWGIYLWGKNLADETHLAGGENLFSGIVLTRGINEGRTFGIELRGRL